MITATTPSLAERETAQTLGVVTGEAIIGGRAGGYEKALREARDIALKEMCDEARSLGADAVVGVDLDYETLGVENGMLMVSASGTAVKLR